MSSVRVELAKSRRELSRLGTRVEVPVESLYEATEKAMRVRGRERWQNRKITLRPDTDTRLTLMYESHPEKDDRSDSTHHYIRATVKKGENLIGEYVLSKVSKTSKDPNSEPLHFYRLHRVDPQTGHHDLIKPPGAELAAASLASLIARGHSRTYPISGHIRAA